MNDMPKISVIVPVYKVEKYLRRCLDSILAQTYADWECLLIDDGSPDNSGAICDEYARRDERFRVFHVKNGGVSRARNIGLDNMTGEWVTFIDSDDWIDPDNLETSMSAIVRDNLDILQYSYHMTDEKDRIVGTQMFNLPVMSSGEFVRADHYSVCVGGGYIVKSLIDRLHLRFNEQIHLAEDQLFMMEAISNARRIGQTDKVFYHYFQNTTSATHNHNIPHIEASMEAVLDFGRTNPLFKPNIDRTISSFYIAILYTQKRFQAPTCALPAG